MIRLIIVIIMILANSMFIQASNRVMINNIKHISQYPELPTGCEVTALAILLNHSGVGVSKLELANKIKKAPKPVYRNGEYSGEHPNNAFIGNPYSVDSYGVFMNPIIDLASNYIDILRIDNMQDATFDSILDRVRSGIPVMVITTRDLVAPKYDKYWTLENGNKFTWPSYEHSMVVVGYDSSTVYVSDPTYGKLVGYSRDRFEDMWNRLGKQALCINKEYEPKKVYLGGELIGDALIDYKDTIWLPVDLIDNIVPNVRTFTTENSTRIEYRKLFRKETVIFDGKNTTLNNKNTDFKIKKIHNKLYIDSKLIIIEFGLKIMYNNGKITI